MTTPRDTPEPAESPRVGAQPGADPVEAARERVMAALSDVDDVAGWPPADQVSAYAAAHSTLQATLAGIDEH